MTGKHGIPDVFVSVPRKLWKYMCVRVCVCMHIDPIARTFVSDVQSRFLCVDNVIWELFEGMYSNIVVIIAYVVSCVVLSLSINLFYSVCSFVKSVVLIVVHVRVCRN